MLIYYWKEKIICYEVICFIKYICDNDRLGNKYEFQVQCRVIMHGMKLRYVIVIT